MIPFNLTPVMNTDREHPLKTVDRSMEERSKRDR